MAPTISVISAVTKTVFANKECKKKRKLEYKLLGRRTGTRANRPFGRLASECEFSRRNLFDIYVVKSDQDQPVNYIILINQVSSWLDVGN